MFINNITNRFSKKKKVLFYYCLIPMKIIYNQNLVE
jgi:hypothetical protein